MILFVNDFFIATCCSLLDRDTHVSVQSVIKRGSGNPQTLNIPLILHNPHEDQTLYKKFHIKRGQICHSFSKLYYFTFIQIPINLSHEKHNKKTMISRAQLHYDSDMCEVNMESYLARGLITFVL